MKRLLFLIVAFYAVVSLAQVGNGTVSTGAKTQMTVEVDSVDFRTDLTRVYCHINGHPHTAQRIDRVVLEAPGISVAATDIDGVDFERYFQWEDDGVIKLELDFDPLHKLEVITLKVATVYGPVNSAQTPLRNGKAVR